MVYKFLTGFVFLALVVVGVVFVLDAKNKGRMTRQKKLLFGALTVIGALGFILVPNSFHQINTGEIAVVRHLGKITKTRQAGVHFDLWLTDEYEIYDAKVQQVQINTPAYSKDGQTLDIQVVIQYQIQPENVENIATVYGGLSMLESRIETIAIERTKSVLSEKTAMETIETRNIVSKDVTDRVSDAISEDYYVNINSVVLTNIDFTTEFERIVEEKVAAEQEAQKAKNEAEKKKTEAEAAKLVAQLEADAELYKAEKEAEAVKVKAKADAEALALKSVEVARMLGYTINETISEEETIYEIVFDDTHTGADILAYLEYVAYVEAWDGVLPTTIVGDDAAQIILPLN